MQNMEDFTHFNEEGRAKMVDVGEKPVTKRTAAASARVLVSPETFRLIRTGGMKKGDVLTVAQIAGIMGAKHTPDLIPMCHPVFTSGTDLSLTLDEAEHAVRILATVSCEGKTGVEMEALTAASVAALTVYDMCKAVQKDIVITDLRLEEKTGGVHGDYRRAAAKSYTAAVITVSDKGSQGLREDTSGPALCELAEKNGLTVVYRALVPDEAAEIRKELLHCADELRVSLVLTTGGTGFSPRDITPESTAEVLERLTPGIPEAMRAESTRITPRGCLSRGIAGIRGQSLIINLPGSRKAAAENLSAVMEALLHGLDMLYSAGSADCGEPQRTAEARPVRQSSAAE